MSMLAFFPWLHVKEPVTVGPYALVPFTRSTSPGGEIQSTLDVVLAPYHLTGHPVKTATLLQLENHDLTDPLTDEERDAIFLFAELLAFTGLANREYFEHFHYANRDTFSLVIQAFEDPNGGVAITTRRRDGGTTAYWGAGSYIVRRPEHVASPARFSLDSPFLAALLTLRSHEDWLLFEEAVFAFNRANTDRPDTSQQSEVVATVGAFERVLDCRRGKEDELAARFGDVWRPSRSLLPRSCPRLPADLHKRGISESWLRDFFRTRGELAHGKKQAERQTLWTVEEHLLLGAFAFPLLVKQLLAKRGLYTLTDGDRDDLDVFEPLAAADLFQQVEGEAGDTEWPWGRIRREMGMTKAFEAL